MISPIDGLKRLICKFFCYLKRMVKLWFKGSWSTSSLQRIASTFRGNALECHIRIYEHAPKFH
jgi:hypothetical protein